MKNSPASPESTRKALARHIIEVASSPTGTIYGVDLALDRALTELRQLPAENLQENLRLMAAQLKTELSSLKQDSLTVHLLCYAYSKIVGCVSKDYPSIEHLCSQNDRSPRL